MPEVWGPRFGIHFWAVLGSPPRRAKSCNFPVRIILEQNGFLDGRHLPEVWGPRFGVPGLGSPVWGPRFGVHFGAVLPAFSRQPKNCNFFVRVILERHVFFEGGGGRHFPKVWRSRLGVPGLVFPVWGAFWGCPGVPPHASRKIAIPY